DIESISLDYKESRRKDRYGNAFRFRARVMDVKQSHVGRWAWDVFLKGGPANPAPKLRASYFNTGRSMRPISAMLHVAHDWNSAIATGINTPRAGLRN